MEDYNEYFKIARIFTQVYAKAEDKETCKGTHTNTNISPNTQANSHMFAKCNSDVEMRDCHMIDSENIDYFNNNVENTCASNSNNSLKIKSLSNEINFAGNNENSQNMNILGNYDYTLLSRAHSRSFNLKNQQNFFKSKNSFSYTQNRKISAVTVGEGEFFMNKPNINSLPFILRSNSFCNNENVNLVVTQNSNTNPTFFQNPTPTRSKKEEIKKWLSRI